MDITRDVIEVLTEIYPGEYGTFTRYSTRVVLVGMGPRDVKVRVPVPNDGRGERELECVVEAQRAVLRLLGRHDPEVTHKTILYKFESTTEVQEHVQKPPQK